MNDDLVRLIERIEKLDEHTYEIFIKKALELLKIEE